MPSTINADNGVVSGSSGVKTTADTSGVLALQSNGTTALTINTDLSATFAGAVTASSFSGTTTTATNLAGGSNGTVPYQSASGTTQMLAAGTSGQVLTSGGVGAPTWTTPSAGAIGTDLSYVDYLLTFSSALANTTGATLYSQSVSLDGTSELMIFNGNTSAHAVVFNTSTNTFGTPVLIRTASLNTSTPIALAKVSSTSVLVCTLPSSTTSLETVVLTVSGSTITVGTPVATTLSASSSLIPANTRLITVGTSYVLSYYNTTGTSPKFRAITVSGTVPTVGAEVASSDGTTFASHHTYTNSSTVFVSFSNDLSSQTLSVRGYSVSGTTITASGSVVQLGTVNATICTAPLDSGRYVLMYATSSAVAKCAVIRLTGSTVASSVAAANLNIAATFAPRIQAFANQAFVLTGTTAGETLSVLTDTSGTASLSGTPITIGSLSMVGYLSTSKVFLANTTSGSSQYYQYGISSGNPVEEKRFDNATSTTAVTAQTFTGSFNTYSTPLGNFTTNNNYSVPAIRTSTGKTALGYASLTPFTISIDGTYAAKLQQAANPGFVNYNDAISGAVTWCIATTTSATATTFQVRKVTLV
jgi:hypothetical protein